MGTVHVYSMFAGAGDHVEVEDNKVLITAT